MTTCLHKPAHYTNIRPTACVLQSGKPTVCWSCQIIQFRARHIYLVASLHICETSSTLNTSQMHSACLKLAFAPKNVNKINLLAYFHKKIVYLSSYDPHRQACKNSFHLWIAYVYMHPHHCLSPVIHAQPTLANIFKDKL